jgi:NADH-quinone oxidoreductase subunit L
MSSLAAAILTTLPPLAAFGAIMVFLRTHPKAAAATSLFGAFLSLAGALFLLLSHWGAPSPLVSTSRWLTSGTFTLPVGVLLDPASLLMLFVVTVICLLVQIYSIGYMAGDPGFGRYFAYMSLFEWAMTSMTLSPTLLQLYVFWELVGLASYLLIGFWFEKFSASEAGKKAFVMTRLGDVAFFLGLLLVLFSLGNVNILDMNQPETFHRMTMEQLTLSSLLIFGGVMGKSAQFPLLTWLPDAMEGPTPVSALLHSATMVAAGVFLFARLFPFFSLSPATMGICLAIGTVSMLLSSTMAMVARDIKQVWAYSTISQLGFMIMGLAAGGYTAGVFHLTTHAFFKALLFLCSGVFIHAYGTNDMMEIGRSGGRRLRTPMVCMGIGAGALAGLPPLSGFFSKELIMGTLADLDNPLWLGAGLLGAFLTAYYTFRLIFVIACPSVIGGGTAGDQSHQHHHGAPAWAMSTPLLLLAGLTLTVGFGQSAIERFLLMGAAPQAGGHHGWLPYAAVGLALCGILIAWIEFGRRGAPRIGFVDRMPAIASLFANRWYLDVFWRWFLDVVIYRIISRTCTANDRKVIDRGIDGMGSGTIRTGHLMSRLQNSMLQYRLVMMFVVMVFLSLYFFF